MKSTIVSVNWLRDNSKNKNLIILDTSSGSNISGKESTYSDRFIPNSRFFDLKNKFSDSSSPFPNTLPSAEQFEKEAIKLGINNDSTIVVYDNLGIYNSPRVWWMFKAMGHNNVTVLDGGLPAWIDSGNKTVSAHTESAKPGNFKTQPQPNLIRNYKQMLENVTDKKFNVMDARSKGRFDGGTPEPRAGLSSGHIPKSFNLPFEDVLENGFMKSKRELKALFTNVNSTTEKMVFSCGSGLTACTILLAAELVLPNEKAVYDGSWTEWASMADSPIERE